MSRSLCRLAPLLLGLAGAMAWYAPAMGQELDVLGLASELSGESSELQKAADGLKDRREEVEKETQALKTEERKVAEMKAAASNSNDPGPVEGPYYLITGAYSNAVDTKGRSESEAFGGPPPSGRRYDSLQQAHNDAMAHMRGNNQPSFRIEDSQGNVLESGNKYSGRYKLLDASRLANPTAPRADNAAVSQAEKALASRRAAAERAKQEYLAEKTAYDRNLAAYEARVKQLNETLPNYLKEIGTPTPTAEELQVARGDFGVADFTSLARQYRGKTVGDGSALAFVREAAGLPEPSLWAPGEKVAGSKVRPGTPIGTFKADGSFVPGRGSHLAVYVTQNAKGIWVYDQYRTAAGVQRPVETRFIRFKNGQGSPSNDASAYAVIKNGIQVPDLPPETP